MRKISLIALVCFLFSLFASSNLKADSSFFYEEGISKALDPTTADYIIVGVGTAGGLAAKRLTDDKKTSVIALHIGENLTKDPLIKYSKNAIFTVLAALLGASEPINLSDLDIPVPSPEFANLLTSLPSSPFPLYQTGFSIPQIDADNRSLLWVLALPEGGASSINAGAWCRGTNQLYAQWEAIAGPNWSVKRILKIYKDLENYHDLTTNWKSRGSKGPIDVRLVPISKLSYTFAQGVVKGTGFPLVLDYNDPKTPIGVSNQIQLTQSNYDGSLRVSSATAFLNKHVMKPDGRGVGRRKLRVYFNSTGLKALWQGNKAIGVEYSQNGEIKQVYANKGVIVCAGLFSSPFLLQSGVGPQSLLQSLNIPVVYDNPNIGQGLADQPHIVLLFSSNPADMPSKNSLFASIAWLPAPGGDPTIRSVRFTTAPAVPGITIGILDLCQPLSRGSVSINSSNPLVPPVIDLGELTNPSDLTLFQNAFTTYIKSINIALQKIDPLYQLIFPDPSILDNPALLTEFIRSQIGANMHFQSHCRMAPLDQGGVVDSTGHVYGVQNLIVADNSIVPQGMDGSPMASAYLIAENIVRLILGE